MNTKRIISILTALCLIISCFTGVISVSAEENVLPAIALDTIHPAILADGAGEIAATATEADGTINIAVTSELLKRHANEGGSEAYWAGFAVVAPEGADGFKYALGSTDEITLSTEISPVEASVFEDKAGVAFYAKAETSDVKYAKLQWFAGADAVSAETDFVMDLTGVVCDGIDTIYPAILAEGAGEISIEKTQEDGYVEIAIASEGLNKHHKNGADDGEEAYWTGFAVTAPEGANGFKYAFGAANDPIGGEIVTELEANVYEDKAGVAFYAKAENPGDRYAKLQWFADDVAISPEMSFVMNLDDVVLAGYDANSATIYWLDKKTSDVDFVEYSGSDLSVDFDKIKMEYYEGAPVEYVTEFDVANVADYDDAENVVYEAGSYKVELIDDVEYYHDPVINITMKDLKPHTNGNGDEGHWTGFTAKAPEGAKKLSYWKTFGVSNSGVEVLAEGEDEVSFYIDVATSVNRPEIYLQWLDENDEPVSSFEYYAIHLFDVELAGEKEVTFKEANVCDSFPGANAPAKMYETYKVAEKDGVIDIDMTDLVLHRNANKDPGYWTGFTVTGPENATQLAYWKDFGNNPGYYEIIAFDTEESFYIDYGRYHNYSNRSVTIQFLDENDEPLTREMYYEIDLSDVQPKYPEPNTIGKANVADYDGDVEVVYDAYDVACEDTIVLSATNLKEHTNGNGDEGHWIGFSVAAPEGATHYSYYFQGNENDWAVLPLGENEDSISFYVNASDPDAKDYLEIRWYSDETDPASYPYSYDYYAYNIDITEVDLADDVEVTVLGAANIANTKAPETAPYTGTPSATVVDGKIKLAVDGLQTHFNAEDNIGAWVGVSISKPADATHVKYVFDQYAWWGSANYTSVDGVADADSISFYTDASDLYPKKEIMIQWFKDGKAITNIYSYELDLSAVKKAIGNTALTIEKANIVDQANPTIDPFLGDYDATLVNDTIKLSADFLKDHENGVGRHGSWIGFKASVEGAKYVKYLFDNEINIDLDRWNNDWDNNATVAAISGSETFYVDASDYYYKDTVMLQWFDENGYALTDVKTYKIDIENVTLEEYFDILYSNIELTGKDARFYESADQYVQYNVSTEDYVYILTHAENGGVTLTVNGTDESNGGNVFYRNAGKTVTLTATPASGYIFNGWYDMNGNFVSSNVSYTVALDACYDLEARFRVYSGRPGSSGGSGAGGVSVAKPVASVPAGEVEAGTKVELSTKTEDAVIYYTLDGTAPSTGSTLYTEAIVINETTTIKAIAVKDKAKSAILTVKYTVKEGEVPPVGAPSFLDIGNFTWANEAITALAEKGIIAGISETEFAPANNIRRADFMLLLVRMLGLQAEVTDNFNDVASDKYYYEGVGIAKALGLTSGVGDNNFKPEESITRQDMFVLAYRILKMQEAGLVEADESAISTFDDFAKIAEYAKEGLAALVASGLVKGSDNNLNPVGNASRAETAVFVYALYNFLNK